MPTPCPHHAHTMPTPCLHAPRGAAARLPGAAPSGACGARAPRADARGPRRGGSGGGYILSVAIKYSGCSHDGYPYCGSTRRIRRRLYVLSVAIKYSGCSHYGYPYCGSTRRIRRRLYVLSVAIKYSGCSHDGYPYCGSTRRIRRRLYVLSVAIKYSGCSHDGYPYCGSRSRIRRSSAHGPSPVHALHMHMHGQRTGGAR